MPPEAEKQQGKFTAKMLEEMDRRLGLEMGRCHAQYDQARADLQEHVGRMSEEEDKLDRKAREHEPHVDALLSGERELDRDTARHALAYLANRAKAAKHRAARRSGHWATQPPGEMPIGAGIE